MSWISTAIGETRRHPHSLEQSIAAFSGFRIIQTKPQKKAAGKDLQSALVLFSNDWNETMDQSQQDIYNHSK